MPSRYPVEVRRQVVALARSGTRVAQIRRHQKGLITLTLNEVLGHTGSL